MSVVGPLRRWPHHPLVDGGRRAWRCGVLGCLERHRTWLGAWLHRLFHGEYIEGLW